MTQQKHPTDLDEVSQKSYMKYKNSFICFQENYTRKMHFYTCKRLNGLITRQHQRLIDKARLVNDANLVGKLTFDCKTTLNPFKHYGMDLQV